jgi:hypothetical protein
MTSHPSIENAVLELRERARGVFEITSEVAVRSALEPLGDVSAD